MSLKMSQQAKGESTSEADAKQIPERGFARKQEEGSSEGAKPQDDQAVSSGTARTSPDEQLKPVSTGTSPTPPDDQLKPVPTGAPDDQLKPVPSRTSRTTPVWEATTNVVLVTTTHWPENPYMKMLYSELKRKGAHINTREELDLRPFLLQGPVHSQQRSEPDSSSTLAVLASQSEFTDKLDPDECLKLCTSKWHETSLIFHLHTVKETFAGAATLNEIQWLAGIILQNIQLVQALGGIVIWTPHDLFTQAPRFPEAESKARQEIADRVDRILLTWQGAARVAKDRYGYSLPRTKTTSIQHSSYLSVIPGTGRSNQLDPIKARKSFGLKPTDIALLFFGNIRPSKGIREMLQAFHKAYLQEPNLRLLIAGSVKEFDTKQEQEDLAEIMVLLKHPAINAKLKFIEDSETPRFFAAADVVLIPHMHVVQSGTLMLAFSFGRPVLATNLGCFPDIVTSELGRVFDCMCQDSYATALVESKLLIGPKFRDAAFKYAELHHFEKGSQEYAKLVNSTLALKRRVLLN